jgi:1-acyl-sn-glycerol-3-phosphate acyltransferase
LVTWNEAAPPALDPIGPAQKVRGALRVAGVVTATTLALGLFIPGKVLRRRVWRGVTYHFTVARMWSRVMLALMGVRLSVVGRPIAAGGVIAANHASWADILALRACRTMNFVSKAEVRAWPAVGWIADQCETVFIERRRTATKSQQDVLRARIEDGQALCIFPEGTSSDGRRVLPFKSALLSFLFEDGLRETPVQGATVNWIAPPGQPEEFFGWWGAMPFEGHIWDVVCRSRGARVEVVFHEPASAADLGDRKMLARALEQQVRSAKR